MEIETFLIALTLLFELGLSDQVQLAKGINISSTEITSSFRASPLSKPKITNPTKSQLTTKASKKPITTIKRFGQTTKPNIKNQQLQKTTPKKKFAQHIDSKAKTFATTKKTTALLSLDFLTVDPLSFPSAKEMLRSATEAYEDYVYLNEPEEPALYNNLTTGTTLNTTLPTEAPDTSTVEDVTRKRLKRRKTTPSDPALTTRRRLKRTKTTTVGPENA